MARYKKTNKPHNRKGKTMHKFIVTTDSTTFFSIEVEAESHFDAIKKASQTPIENWDENNVEFSLIYEAE